MNSTTQLHKVGSAHTNENSGLKFSSNAGTILQDFIEPESIQSLLDDFYKLTGLPVSITDLNGNLLVGVGWQKICSDFHRINPVSCRNCIESDTILTQEVKEGEFKLYKCKNNMWEMVTPLVLNSKHVGNMFIGQFFFADERLDYEIFRQQAKSYGYDKKEYLNCLESVSRLPREKVLRGMSLLIKLANNVSKLNQLNAKYVESEKKWRQLAESMPNMIWTCSSEGKCDYLSPQWLNYTGSSEKENLGWGWLKQIHPDDRKSLLQSWNEAVSKKQKFNMDIRVRRHDGTFRWFKSCAVPVIDSTGRVIKWYGSNSDIEDIKGVQKSLQESQLDLNRAQAVANVGSWRLDLQNNQLMWSDEAHRIFGVSKGTPLTYETFLNTVHPEDRQYVNAKWLSALDGVHHYDIEHRIIVNGKVKWVSEKAEIESDKDGNIIGGFGTTQDITAGKEVRESMNYSLRRFAIIAHTASQLLHTAEPQKLIESVCLKVMELLDCQMFLNFILNKETGWLNLNASIGISDDKKKNLYLEEAICGCVAQAGRHIVIENAADRHDDMTAFIRSYGINAYACHPLLGLEGDIIGTLSFGTRSRKTFSEDDLSIMKAVCDLVAAALMRIKTEEALRLSEERFRLATCATNDGIWDYDIVQGRIWCNETYNNLFGPRLKESAGTLDWWLENIHSDDRERVVTSLKNALAGIDGQWDCEYKFMCGNKRTAYVHDRAYILRNEAGDAVRLLGAMHDITEQKEAEQVLERDKDELEKLVQIKTNDLLAIELEMEKVKRLSDIGMLAATVAHELRNPLAAISIAAGNIKRKINAPVIDKHMHTIEKKVGESDQIINNLLFYARLRIPNYENVNLCKMVIEIMEGCCNGAANKEIKTIANLVRIQNLTVEADPLHIHELFINIINNAYDAIGDKDGLIEIDAFRHDERHIKLRVSDNGCGMDDSTLQKIWEPFYSTKSKGTGLGLSVCSQIVRLHNGSIDIASEKGKGTVVTIILPLYKNNNVLIKPHH